MMRARLRILSLFCAAIALAAHSAGAEELGDAKRGAQIFKRCASCHVVGEGARRKQGPHLNMLFGRRAAGLDGYDYSKPMHRAGADGLVWNFEKLDAFLENPKALVSNTRMKFGGVKRAQDRADLLAFLRIYSDDPRDIPESAPTARPDDPDVKPEILAIEGDPAYGEYLSAECVTCHRMDGADMGVPSITGWPKGDFIVAMHAYKTKARPHPVMQMMASRLSDEEIAGLAVYFEGLKNQ